MSVEVTTSHGVLRRVTRDGETCWLLKCPGCDQWGGLDATSFTVASASITPRWAALRLPRNPRLRCGTGRP